MTAVGRPALKKLPKGWTKARSADFYSATVGGKISRIVVDVHGIEFGTSPGLTASEARTLARRLGQAADILIALRTAAADEITRTAERDDEILTTKD